MKIDVLVGVAFRGGVEEVMNETCRYLQEAGHEIRIVQCIWQEKEWADAALQFSYLLNVEKEEWNGDFNIIANAYKSFVEKEGYPEIVLATGWPVLVSIARAVVENRAKVISWMHGDLYAYTEEGFGGYPELSAADAHFCINDVLKNGIAENIIGASVYSVRNPINLKRICYNENRNLHRIAYVGRLSKEKNIPYLLQSFAMTDSTWSLDVIGDTDVPNGLQVLDEYCASLGIQNRVFFHGWQENPWEILSEDAALILTSDREGAPLVISEALLCGMFIITTPTNGANALVKTGENGFFIPFQEPDFLAKILKLMEKNDLSVPSAQACRESAEYLLEKTELREFENYLEEVKNTD